MERTDKNTDITQVPIYSGLHEYDSDEPKIDWRELMVVSAICLFSIFFVAFAIFNLFKHNL